MKEEKELYYNFLNLFLTENLNVTTIKLITLLNVSKATFYSKFNDKEDFIQNFFDYILEPIYNKRRMIIDYYEFDYIVKEINKLIYDKISKYKIDIKNLEKNLETYHSIVYLKYGRLILLNYISRKTFVNNELVSTETIIEEGYNSLLSKIIK